jgi:hypothetical protein
MEAGTLSLAATGAIAATVVEGLEYLREKLIDDAQMYPAAASPGAIAASPLENRCGAQN